MTLISHKNLVLDFIFYFIFRLFMLEMCISQLLEMLIIMFQIKTNTIRVTLILVYEFKTIYFYKKKQKNNSTVYKLTKFSE